MLATDRVQKDIVSIEERHRVVFLTNGLAAGGAEKQLLLIAGGLAARGIDCVVVAMRDGTIAGRLENSIQVARQSGVVFFRVSNLCELLFRWGAFFNQLSTGRCLVWSWGDKAEFLRLTLFPFVPGVFSLRSASLERIGRWPGLLKASVFTAKTFVSNSRRAVEMVEGVAFGAIRKARVVHNSIERDFLMRNVGGRSCRPDSLKVCMLGNIRYFVKGYDLALKAAEKMRSANIPFRIHVAGAQYEGQVSLRDEIDRAGLSQVVSWLGPTSDSLAFLEGGDVFLLLSRYEGMPNALFEAMAVGLPCVSSDVGDLRYHERESQGLKVVPVEDPEAAFQQLKWIWENWDEAQSMARRGQEYCRKHFSEDVMIEKVIKALGLDRKPEPVI